MSQSASITALLGLTLIALPAYATEKRELTTPRGAKVPAVLHLPKTIKGKRPALVIAPGRGYPMKGPLLVELAKECADRGIIAVRFDWAYTAAKGGPSKDLAKEVEDMETALAATLADERVDPARVFLAGKSMGTRVAYRIFKERPELEGLFLLTPLTRGGFDKNYPGIGETKRPLLLTLGDRDPLCPLTELYAALAKTGRRIPTLVFGGDHGMNVTRSKDPKLARRNAANVKAAVKASAHWLQLMLDRSS